jgi:hypothetical protein
LLQNLADAEFFFIAPGQMRAHAPVALSGICLGNGARTYVGAWLDDALEWDAFRCLRRQ